MREWREGDANKNVACEGVAYEGIIMTLLFH